ncbi:MAG: hypothetical protein A2Z03_04680 [Chloroflexi bacterium RBG_16_56_8]|nr:MAG: hypothetical protein A2Z03_04680 [Chloroflexi bacterium RBG_16_56_8]
MPPVGPVKRKGLIRYFRLLGFVGPFAGGRHQYMVRGQIRVAIPNPHQRDIGVELLLRILRLAGIEKPEWEKL